VWDGHTTGEKYLRIRELTTDLHMRRVTQGDAAASEIAGERMDHKARRAGRSKT
jgi:hypothetical protein